MVIIRGEMSICACMPARIVRFRGDKWRIIMMMRLRYDAKNKNEDEQNYGLKGIINFSKRMDLLSSQLCKKVIKNFYIITGGK